MLFRSFAVWRMRSGGLQVALGTSSVLLYACMPVGVRVGGRKAPRDLCLVDGPAFCSVTSPGDWNGVWKAVPGVMGLEVFLAGFGVLNSCKVALGGCFFFLATKTPFGLRAASSSEEHRKT